MKPFVQVKKEGKWFVATDLATGVADQALARNQAIRRLTKALRERYEVLREKAS